MHHNNYVVTGATAACLITSVLLASWFQNNAVFSTKMGLLGRQCSMLRLQSRALASVCALQQMTAAAVAREKAKLYAEFGRGGGEDAGLADDLAPEEFLELEELRRK